MGHIFQLGTKYSEALNATVLDENGKAVTMLMGCYGIGVSRVVASAIEQNHDDNGIIWPEALAPFSIAICPMNMHKSERVQEAAENIYAAILTDTGSFRFGNTTANALALAAEMVSLGVAPEKVAAEIYESMRPERLQLLSLSLNTLTLRADGRLCW